MPNNTTTYNYGGLSGKGIEVGPADLIFKNKVVRGYWISAELANQELAAKLFSGAFAALASKKYITNVSKTFNHEQWSEAKDYYLANMSKGKVLLQNPNF